MKKVRVNEGFIEGVKIAYASDDIKVGQLVTIKNGHAKEIEKPTEITKYKLGIVIEEIKPTFEEELTEIYEKITNKKTKEINKTVRIKLT